MYRCIVPYLISTLASLAFGLKWDSPFCITCHKDAANASSTNSNIFVAQTDNGIKTLNFRASSSSSSSTESDTSEDDDGTAVTLGVSRQTAAATVPTTDRSTATSTITTSKDHVENLTVRAHHRKHKKKNHTISTEKPRTKKHKHNLRILSTKSTKELDRNHEHHIHKNDKRKRKHETKSERKKIVKEFDNQLVVWHEQLKHKTRLDYKNIMLGNGSNTSQNQVHNKHKRNKTHQEDKASMQTPNNKTSNRYKEQSHPNIKLQEQAHNVGLEVRSKHKHTRNKLKQPLEDTIKIDEIVTQSKHKHKKHSIEETEIGLNIEDEIKTINKEANINNAREILADNTNEHKTVIYSKQEEKIEKQFADKPHLADEINTRSKLKKHKNKTEEDQIETRGRLKHKHHHVYDEVKENVDNIETTTHTRKHKKKKTTTTEYIRENIKNLENNTYNSHELKNISRQAHKNRNLPTTKYYDIPFSPHKIKEDEPINAFTKQILLRTLRLFENVRKNSSEYEWKKKIKHLAENYEHKFKEFLRSSAQQNIRTKLGTQKVVLNAIDMSKHIANRLLNIMMDNIDKKGLLRTSRTQDVFYAELRKEVDSELNHACSKLGICSPNNGFFQIVMDVIHTMLSLNDERFKEAFDSLTDAVEFTDFSHTLGKATDARLKKKFKSLELENRKTQRAMVNIMKNVLMNRNKPLVMYSDSDPKRSNINGTLAFLEVIDILDKAVPIDDANINEWTQIRENMMLWSSSIGIQSTIRQFVHYIKKAIDDLNSKNYNAVLKNITNML